MSGFTTSASLLEGYLWFLDMAMKSFVLLVLVIPCLWLLRRRAAALRHFILSAAMAALVLMPMVSLMAPSWHWTVFPVDATVLSGPVPGAGEKLPSDIRTVEMTPALGEQNAPAQPATFRLPPSVWVLGLWFMGFAWVMLKVVRSNWRTGRVVRAAEIVREPLWTSQLQDCRRNLNLNLLPKILSTAQVRGPMAVGLVKTAILIPPAALTWPADQIKATLLHELAHLKRRDLNHQLIAQLACAFYWFNPLVWIAAGKLVFERELASDDFVLNTGMRPSNYASHLLAACGQVLPNQKNSPLEVVAMAKGTDFKERMVSILNPHTKRQGLDLKGAFIVLILILGLMAPLAAFSPWQKQPSPPPSPTEPVAVKPSLPVEPARPTLPEALPKPTSAALPEPHSEPTRAALPEPAVLPSDYEDWIEDRLELKLERAEEAFERDFESFEDVVEDWEEEMEEDFDERQAEAEEAAFDRVLETLEDKMDRLEDRFEGALDRLETKYELQLEGESETRANQLFGELDREIEGWMRSYKESLAGLKLEFQKVKDRL